MFKKIILLLMCVPAMFAVHAAQLSATLQSGDKVTPFYGANALVEAHEAAVDGDIITLSPGLFNTVEISKSVTIIGVYGFNDDTSKVSLIGTLSHETSITADNVTLEGVRANSFLIKGVDNLTIKRSRLNKLCNTENGENKYHNNTTVTDSYISDYAAMDLSKNTVLRNCCIDKFSNINESANPALIENSSIAIFNIYISSNYKQPYAIYRNCYLGLYKSAAVSTNPILSFNSPTEFHDVYFYNNQHYSKTSQYSTPYDLDFGSCITSGIKEKLDGDYNVPTYTEVYRYGILGTLPIEINGVTYGPENFNFYPSNPLITSSEIDTETDAEGKLHVKISAEARN